MADKYISSSEFDAMYPPGVLLGSGTYGRVSKTMDGKYVRKDIVRIDKDGNKEPIDCLLIASILPEIDAYVTLEHPNLCTLVHWTINSDLAQISIALPLGMSIVSALKSGKTTLIQVFNDLLAGISFMNRNGYAHCDLKPENVVFYDNRTIIIDFGLIKKANLMENEDMVIAGTAYTLPFRDPEYSEDYYNTINVEHFSVAWTIYGIYLSMYLSEDEYWTLLMDERREFYQIPSMGEPLIDEFVKRLLVYPARNRLPLTDIYLEWLRRLRVENPMREIVAVGRRKPVAPLNKRYSCDDQFVLTLSTVAITVMRLDLSARTLFAALDICHRVYPYTKDDLQDRGHLTDAFFWLVATVIVLGSIASDDGVGLTYQTIFETVNEALGDNSFFDEQRDIQVTNQSVGDTLAKYMIYLDNRITYPTYWKLASSVSELPQLLSDTLKCTYNPEYVRDTLVPVHVRTYQRSSGIASTSKDINSISLQKVVIKKLDQLNSSREELYPVHSTPYIGYPGVSSSDKKKAQIKFNEMLRAIVGRNEKIQYADETNKFASYFMHFNEYFHYWANHLENSRANALYMHMSDPSNPEMNVLLKYLLNRTEMPTPQMINDKKNTVNWLTLSSREMRSILATRY